MHSASMLRAVVRIDHVHAPLPPANKEGAASLARGNEQAPPGFKIQPPAVLVLSTFFSCFRFQTLVHQIHTPSMSHARVSGLRLAGGHQAEGEEGEVVAEAPAGEEEETEVQVGLPEERFHDMEYDDEQQAAIVKIQSAARGRAARQAVKKKVRQAVKRRNPSGGSSCVRELQATMAPILVLCSLKHQIS